jgi:uncharacterized protein (TIGR00290 family)
VPGLGERLEQRADCFLAKHQNLHRAKKASEIKASRPYSDNANLMGWIIEMTDKVIMSWSGGKDCAYALHTYLQHSGHEVATLLTTVTQGYNRISMHGVRRSLLKSQAMSIGYPLDEVLIPQQCTDEEYKQLMGMALDKYNRVGVEGVVFGDLFLEDVRNYREERLGRIGMKGIFPLWGFDTAELALSFIDIGFRAVVVCVDTEALDGEYVGREYDRSYLADIPKSVDPCGEHGEFHTFVYDGPLFSRMIEFKRGEKVLREGRFYFCDLVPLDRCETQEMVAV